MVPIDAVVLYLWGTSREYQETDEALYRTAGIAIPEVAAPEVEVGSPRIFPANIFRIARTGVEAAVELYFLTPYSVFLATTKAKKQPDVEPMIRLQIPGPVLTGILRRINSMVPELKARLGILLPNMTPVKKAGS
jgi:hypothetical protein